LVEIETKYVCSEPGLQVTTPVAEGKVSIIIPCFNHGAMLREALASVERVRNENLLEVIIVDDGSSEAETIRILKEVAEAGYRVVSQPNRRQSAARNAGIRLANGEFILPLDSDNRIRDAYLNEAVALLKENPSLGVIYADAEYFGEKTGRWPVQDFDLLSLLRMNFIDVCALYRKALWEEVGGYDEQMPCMGVEDWDFWLRVVANGGTFLHLPKVGFDYCVRADSQIVKTIGFDCRMAREAVNLVEASPRLAELVNYVFGKPEMASYKILREADEAIFNAREILVKSGFRPAGKQVLRALCLSHSPPIIWEICSFFVLWFRIIASRVKRRIKSKFNASGHS
jgi:glycosyltransferase involved in cell wall biosynthesis